MTEQARRLGTPRIVASAFAVGTTARAMQARALAELCDDAATGHPGQRSGFGRTVASALRHTYWLPNRVPRFLRVQVLFTSSAVTPNGASLSLSITDGATTVAPPDPEIPAGLNGVPDHISGYATSTPSRLGAGQLQTWYLDVDALAAAGLSRTADWWRFSWDVGITSPAEIEWLQVDELPRWLVDDAAAFGQIPNVYFAQGLIVDGTPNGLQRLYETARVGLTDGVSTYHCLGRPEADAWTITSGTLASFGGSDEEASGTPARYGVRAKRMRGDGSNPRVRYLLRYRITGVLLPGDTATVRLTTGAGTYDAVLTDLTGSWVESAWTTAHLDVSGGALDEIKWRAKVSNPLTMTLQVSARHLIDYPDP